MKNDELKTLIPSAIALAMGVASVVLMILKESSQETILTLLAIAVLCLGFVGVTNHNK